MKCGPSRWKILFFCQRRLQRDGGELFWRSSILNFISGYAVLLSQTQSMSIHPPGHFNVMISEYCILRALTGWEEVAQQTVLNHIVQKCPFYVHIHIPIKIYPIDPPTEGMLGRQEGNKLWSECRQGAEYKYKSIWVARVMFTHWW